MQLYPAAVFKLLVPGILVGAAFWARGQLHALDNEARVIVDYLPYLLCLAALLMAYQFGRGRMVLASLGVAAFYWTVHAHLQVSLTEADAARVYLVVSLAVPLLCLYLLLVPERGIFTVHALLFAGGFVVLLAVVVYLGPLLPRANEAAQAYYAPWPGDGYVLSRGATFLVGLVAAAVVGLLCLRHDEIDAALFGALVALYLALAFLHLRDISVAMSSAAGLCLLWGLMRSSHAMAYRDELTGLPGRRALNERLKMLGRRYTIAMVDVDHFKRFNDTYGHDVGDQVLRLVASRLRRVRGGTAYRYGGEEFCVVFSRRALAECVEPMQAVRQEIADYEMSLRDNTLRPQRRRAGSRRRGATRLNSGQVSVTVSAGLAARSEDHPDAESVIRAADQNLYKAKKAGRNRVAH